MQLLKLNAPSQQIVSGPATVKKNKNIGNIGMFGQNTVLYTFFSDYGSEKHFQSTDFHFIHPAQDIN